MKEVPDHLQPTLKGATERFHTADEHHSRQRERWDELDALYHNVNDWTRGLNEARGRSRYQQLRDGMNEFGAELFIPFSFTVVETVLPRMLSNRPKMLILPRTKASEPNVEPMRLTVDAQQQRCGYELKLQSTGKSGLTYGLGVQKTWWRSDVARRVQRMQQRPVEKTNPLFPWRKETALEWVPVEVPDPEAWDDPDTANVSVYDFLWDPYGDSMETVEYVIQRSWRSTSYCLGKIKSGAWPLMPDLTAEDIANSSGKEHYTSTWKGRRNVQGDVVSPKGEIHEVWEVWTRDKVTVVLDRQWPVAEFNNPHPVGRFPFQIYRPTEILGQFCGKGEIEPIRDLQYEINSLRTDRRWNALLVLHKAFWYEDGAIDPALVKIEPGALNPTNGPPGDVLKEIMPGDIPFSSYRESEEMKADIDRTTGISDPAQGVGDAGQTATGVQLVQAAAGVRIQNKTRRLEIELIKPQAADFIALNQQRISEDREMRVETPPVPGDPERRWKWFQVGPAQLSGEFEAQPEGGSTAPENVPQMRQDAQMLMQLGAMSQGMLDMRKVMTHALRNLGIEQPESMFAVGRNIPPALMDVLQRKLMDEFDNDPQGVHEFLQEALEEAVQVEESQAAPQPGQAPNSEPMAA